MTEHDEHDDARTNNSEMHVEQAIGVEQIADAGRATDAEQAGQAGRATDAEQACQAGRATDAEQAGQAGRATDAEQAGQAGRATDAEQACQAESLKTYAFVSHESAVEAIWTLAAHDWQGVLDDECVWIVPAPESCVKSQGDFKRLAHEVDLDALGVRLRPIDLLAPDKSCFSRGRCARFHVWANEFPRYSFVRVHDRVFVSTPYFAILQLAMARRQNRITKLKADDLAVQDALLWKELGIIGRGLSAPDLAKWANISGRVRAIQVLCDFMGTYRYLPMEKDGNPLERDVIYGTKPIISMRKMDAYLDEMCGARGIQRAREVATLAFEGSASPMETVLVLVMTLPLGMGGFGLPRPKLNWDIPIDMNKAHLSSQSKIIGDICWPEKRLVVEYYGWDDHFGAGPQKVASDAARTNSLTALGWTVIHVTYEQLRTIAGITLIARQIAKVLDVPLIEPTDLELIWRLRLLAQLLPVMNREC